MKAIGLLIGVCAMVIGCSKSDITQGSSYVANANGAGPKPAVTNVFYDSNHKLNIAGTNLNLVNSLTLTQNAGMLPFSILTKTATMLIASVNASAGTLKASDPANLNLMYDAGTVSLPLTIDLSGTSMNSLTVTGDVAASGKITGSIAANMTTITASVSDNGTQNGYIWSAAVSCPAGTTLVMAALQTCTGYSGNPYQYCTCSKSGNSMQAGYLSYSTSPNANFYSACTGLCVK